MFRHFKTFRSTTRIAFALLCIQLAGACAAFAYETSRGPLVLSKVFIKQNVSSLVLEQSKSKSVFTPTKVTCPAKHTQGCTIRVVTSVEIWDVPADGAMWETLLVSGLINDVVVLEPTPPCCAHSHRTFQFVIPDIEAGSTVTIDLQLENLIGTAYVTHRVETIKLFFD